MTAKSSLYWLAFTAAAIGTVLASITLVLSERAISAARSAG